MKATNLFIPRWHFDLAALLMVACLALFSCSKDETASPASNPSVSNSEKQISAVNGKTRLNTTQAPLQGPMNSLIFISHGSCLGGCATYNIRVSPQGEVVFEGLANTSTIGQVTYQIKQPVAYELAEYMLANGFWSFLDAYPVNPDSQKNITSLTWNDKTKTVVDYGVETPPSLIQMRNHVEEVLNVYPLVHGVNGMAANQSPRKE